MEIEISGETLAGAFQDDARIASLSMPYLLKAYGYNRVRHKTGWLMRKDGKTYKIRAITESGVDLSPSVSKGAGRHDTSQNWEDSRAGIDGFILFDAMKIHDGIVKAWVLSMEDVDYGIQNRVLTGHGKASRQDIMPVLQAVGRLGDCHSPQ